MANKALIENNIEIFQISIEKLEEFKVVLIKFYEIGNDEKIIGVMKNIVLGGWIMKIGDKRFISIKLTIRRLLC